MPRFIDMPLKEFLEQAASDAPAPGGGGVAALVGALGASMASMAANFTVGRPRFAEHEALMRETIAGMKTSIALMSAAVDGDATAFNGIAAAYKLPGETDAEKSSRRAAIRDALSASMRVPLEVLRRAREAAAFLPPLAKVGNPNLLSDVEVAAIMLAAACQAARVNVMVNASQLDTEESRQAVRETEELLGAAAVDCDKARKIVAGRQAG